MTELTNADNKDNNRQPSAPKYSDVATALLCLPSGQGQPRNANFRNNTNYIPEEDFFDDDDIRGRWPDKDSAIKYLESLRWPDGKVVCPKCGSVHVSRRKTRNGNYICLNPNCTHKSKHYEFNVTSCTPMEGTHIPLHKWIWAMFAIIKNRKSLPIKEMAKYIGVQRSTAVYVLQRLRGALDKQVEHLTGIVEVDEAYVGGRERNKHENEKLHIGRGGNGKQAVFGILERDSRNLVVRLVPDTTSNTLMSVIDKFVDKDSMVHSDESKSYPNDLMAQKHYGHKSVNHSIGEFVYDPLNKESQKKRGKKAQKYCHNTNNTSNGCTWDNNPEKNGVFFKSKKGRQKFENIMNNGTHKYGEQYKDSFVSTNGIESVWAILKRGVYGVHHHISRKYMQLYLNEYVFRLNCKGNGLNEMDSIDAFAKTIMEAPKIKRKEFLSGDFERHMISISFELDDIQEDSKTVRDESGMDQYTCPDSLYDDPDFEQYRVPWGMWDI